MGIGQDRKQIGIGQALRANFLGHAPTWYKTTILAFLVLNPILMFTVGKYVTGWVLIVEFIFTLAMALKCYPLPAGGLLAIEAVVIGLTHPHSIYHEVELNLPVILLLMFMVAGIYFMKEGLVYLFTKILTKVRSKVALAFLFSILGAVLSAFLDALTVTAVIIAVAYGFYNIFHKFASSHVHENYDVSLDHIIHDKYHEDLDQFRGFLRNLMMHGAVGTALGGATTLVGEPQNLLIGSIMKWDFVDFFLNSAPVSIPVLIAGLLTAITLEATKFWGYGYQLPDSVRKVMEDDAKAKDAAMDTRGRLRLIAMAVCGVLLIFSLALHLAEVGIIGLMIIILLTAFNGVIEEGRIGHAFEEAMPFTALLIVFFSIVAVIHDQHLFTPIIQWVLHLEGQDQLVAFFAANGILSAISDNVFVATVYMTEAQKAFEAGGIALDHYNKMAVSINMGTNIPSVATPNGQAAFLFLLTSALAPLIRLSYMEMVKLALPYTVVMSITGVLATMYLL
ncbi:sodium/proton antiporter NhaB [Desulfosporosinus nitroreducens]|uniref:sodium/proton antiporter NhaB n=1 Tax=Desulfosporosinus nitroreducens TaxID=2018668 RepID=UPI00207CB6B3|nr:sodium/proton antiporter NhaB [Desulfosporosinus nitroreducens]MCO1602390.1 sodium/proton antiporter NhaB [Desulfosporosinus nitroreducens]